MQSGTIEHSGAQSGKKAGVKTGMKARMKWLGGLSTDYSKIVLAMPLDILLATWLR